ncbi:hypothetical protein [Streptomyces alfalfae]
MTRWAWTRTWSRAACGTATVTHQIEDGADPAFVQRQVGHRYASTTALYTGVSGDFMNAMMRRMLDRALSPDPAR